MHIASTINVLAALSFVVLLAYGIGRAIRRFDLPSLRGRANAPSRLTLQSSLALDPKRRLLLIGCDGCGGLLMTGPHGDTFLGWVPTETVAPGPGRRP